MSIGWKGTCKFALKWPFSQKYLSDIFSISCFLTFLYILFLMWAWVSWHHPWHVAWLFFCFVLFFDWHDFFNSKFNGEFNVHSNYVCRFLASLLTPPVISGFEFKFQLSCTHDFIYIPPPKAFLSSLLHNTAPFLWFLAPQLPPHPETSYRHLFFCIWSSCQRFEVKGEPGAGTSLPAPEVSSSFLLRLLPAQLSLF